MSQERGINLIHAMLTVILVVLTLAQAITIFFTFYQLVIGTIGMFKRKGGVEAAYGAAESRFAVLVCAHNEERVVGQIVDNLNQLDYPKDRYDVYVICDNCSDRTADVVRRHGGNAMERHDTSKKGKGYGLEWMFANLWAMEKCGKKYDAVVIFDADNLASRNFLTAMHQKLASGFEVAQAYLDSKNPEDSWVSKSYAVSYWVTNRVYQLARENLRMSAQLGGTGLMVSTKVLKELGWGATSLTEDLEFTVRYLIQSDNRVAWVHDAKIYDEKPLKMKASFVQRIRWMKGHFDCAIRYSVPLLKKIFQQKRLTHIDMLFYLWQPSKSVLALNTLIFWAVSYAVPLPAWAAHWVITFWVWSAVVGLSYVQSMIGLIQERRFDFLRWFGWMFFFGLTWIPIIAIAFVRRKDKTWSHTQHGRNLSMEDLTQISS